MKRKKFATIAFIVAALALGGCAAGNQNAGGATSTTNSSASDSSVPGLASADLISLDAAVTYPYGDVKIRVEPAGSRVATVSWSRAYETCLTGDSICDSSATPTIALGVVSDSQSGTVNSDGSVTPILNNALAWVITYTGRPCAPAGAAGSAFAAPISSQGVDLPTSMTTPRAYTCTIVNFVSADSGQVLYSFQASNP